MVYSLAIVLQTVVSVGATESMLAHVDMRWFSMLKPDQRILPVADMITVSSAENLKSHMSKKNNDIAGVKHYRIPKIE